MGVQRKFEKKKTFITCSKNGNKEQDLDTLRKLRRIKKNKKRHKE